MIKVSAKKNLPFKNKSKRMVETIKLSRERLLTGTQWKQSVKILEANKEKTS